MTDTATTIRNMSTMSQNNVSITRTRYSRRVSGSIAPILALLVLWAGPVFGQSYTITPSPFQTALDNSGNIINNACIWTYDAGTTTAATTYQTSGGTANANPIRSDSAGRFTAYLTPGSSYKFVYESACTPPAHGTTLRTADNIAAVPVSGLNVDITGTAGEALSAGNVVYLSAGDGGLNAGQWYKADADLLYASSQATKVGIATSAISAAASGSIRAVGRVTGLSGLVVGTDYYISATAGALTATAPTFSRLLGRADSTTSLVAGDVRPITPFSLAITDGRLTATSATPVTTADVTAATSIYYTPYKGNRIALYDGTYWNLRTFSEITISVAACTASRPYDVFLYDNAGTVTAETLVWTSATARATALALQDGVLSKTGALTRRYVGTFYCNATGGQTDDSLAKRYVWNYYHRQRRVLRRLETTASWTYTTATIRQANGAANNQVEAVVGVAEVTIELWLQGQSRNASANVQRSMGFGVGSTSTFSALQTFNSAGAGGTYPADASYTHLASLRMSPPVGYQFYSWNEISAATGTTTWDGITSLTAANSGQAGIDGEIEG